jgi:hypothetical protein
MPWVGTPDASQAPRPHGCYASAFPVGRAGRLLHDGSISGLFIPFTGVPACDLPVYASPGTLPYRTHDAVPDCWLGFVRVAISDDWTFCTCKAQPPSEPGMRLSPHPALQGLASRLRGHWLSFIEASWNQDSLGLHQVISDYFVHQMSIPWRPSPCRRLSRPPSTMTPPTPMRFIGGLLPSPYGPPTFTPIRSTRWCRQGLHATNPALRGILNGYGVCQVTHIILWAGNEVRPASVTFRFVHWPIGQGIEPGASFPVG